MLWRRRTLSTNAATLQLYKLRGLLFLYLQSKYSARVNGSTGDEPTIFTCIFGISSMSIILSFTFQVCNFMHILARLFTLSTRKVQWLCYFDMFFLVHQECSSNADWCYWHKRVRIWEKGQNTLWVLLLGRLCVTRIDCCILPSPPADRLDSALSPKYCLLRAGGRGLSWHGWTTIHGFST